MPTSEELTDTYLAQLLARDASTRSAPKRRPDAPKPNTRFLRNIIRETDNHNAALLARENEESRARLKDLGRKRLSTEDGQGRDAKRHKEGDRPNRWASALGGLGNRVGTTKFGSKYEKDRREHKHDRRKEGEESRREDDGRRKERRHVKSTGPRSRSRSRSPKRRPRDRERNRSTDREKKRSGLRTSSRDRKGHPREEKGHVHESGSSRKATRNTIKQDDSDADPLEELLGPLPLPTVQARGRGARSNQSSGIDLRFNDPSYDPRKDLHGADDDDVGEDDWAASLSALKDRVRGHASRAERLRAAGFSEEEVQKWESSAGTNTAKEKDEKDVVWRKQGEKREWDRGKVVGDKGDIEQRPDWK